MKFIFKATEITEEQNTIILEVEVEANDIFEAHKIGFGRIKTDKRFKKKNVENINIEKVHKKYTVKFMTI